MQGNHRLDAGLGRIGSELRHKTTHRPVATGLRVLLEPTCANGRREPGPVSLEERFGQLQTPVFGCQSCPERTLDFAQSGVQRVRTENMQQVLREVICGIKQAGNDDSTKTAVCFVQAGRDGFQVLQLIAQRLIPKLFAFTGGKLEFGTADTAQGLPNAGQPTAHLGFQVCSQINVPIHEHHALNIEDFAPGPVAGDDPERQFVKDFLLDATAMVVN